MKRILSGCLLCLLLAPGLWGNEVEKDAPRMFYATVEAVAMRPAAVAAAQALQANPAESERAVLALVQDQVRRGAAETVLAGGTVLVVGEDEDEGEACLGAGGERVVLVEYNASEEAVVPETETIEERFAVMLRLKHVAGASAQLAFSVEGEVVDTPVTVIETPAGSVQQVRTQYVDRQSDVTLALGETKALAGMMWRGRQLLFLLRLREVGLLRNEVTPMVATQAEVLTLRCPAAAVARLKQAEGETYPFLPVSLAATLLEAGETLSAVSVLPNEEEDGAFLSDATRSTTVRYVGGYTAIKKVAAPVVETLDCTEELDFAMDPPGIFGLYGGEITAFFQTPVRRHAVLQTKAGPVELPRSIDVGMNTRFYCRVGQALILAEQSDPFLAGTPSLAEALEPKVSASVDTGRRGAASTAMKDAEPMRVVWMVIVRGETKLKSLLRAPKKRLILKK